VPLYAHKASELSRALNRATQAAELREGSAGAAAVADLRGDVRIGYRSPVDDSDQPFCLYVPADYEPQRRWPQMVRLHGMWSEIDEAEWTIQTFEWDREFVRFAPRGSFIELYPWGRGNEGYRDAGLRDVLDTMALVREMFSIDEDRVYLMGSSMGAAGAWRIALRHPDRFAAVCGVVGVYDHALVQNALNLPVMFHYGGQDDPKRVTSPRETARLLEEIGGTAEIVGHPESGHRIETTDYQLSYYRFFGRHRLDRWPRRVIYRTPHLSEGDGAYWVRILQPGDSALPSRIEAGTRETGGVAVETENVSRFELDFTGPIFGEKMPSVTVNGCATLPEATDGSRLTYAA
jgi:poly(3-hydroxybutyrate) depolymerase